MAFPIAAALSAGATILGTGINAFSQQSTNDSNRRNALELYEMQKRDNLAQWHLQNEYNSPQAQMMRLKGAGLNPNLVYGNGSAVNTAAPVPTATPTATTNIAPEWGNAANGLNAYFDTQLKTAQVDNVKAATTLATQQAVNQAMQTAGLGITNAKSSIELDYARENYHNSLEASKESLRKLQIDNQFQLDENERRHLTTGSSLQVQAEQILSSREQRATTQVERQRIRASIEQIKNSNALAELDIQMRRAGIQPNDPLYARVLARAVGSGAGDLLKSLDTWTRDKSKSFKQHLSDYFK